MKRRGKSDLPDEDAALWAYVTRNVTRIEARKRANRPIDPTAEVDPGQKRQHLPPGKGLDGLKPVKQKASQPAPAVTSRAPALNSIEPRKVKRLVRGREEIDARIDLHGMRQVEAHGALRTFLARAYQNGFRMVLVITGKGRDAGADAHAPFDLFQERDRGVLRRNVPRWLAEPDLRGVVAGHTSAHIKHGGEGAFYVQLRNRDKHRG
jgi:DNA-nicking Smr family endonuclease